MDGGLRLKEPISTRTPHAGSDASIVDIWSAMAVFQPALPMRGVTVFDCTVGTDRIFQPALPMRGVTRMLLMPSCIIEFQPALPMRGVTSTMA